MSKKLIYLPCRGCLPRDNDGAIEVWKKKDDLQDHFVFCHHWSDEKWKSSVAGGGGGGGGGGHMKKYQYCADLQEQFCTSELSKVIQDAILLILHYRTMS